MRALAAGLAVAACAGLVTGGAAGAAKARAASPTASISVWFVSNPGPINDYMTSLANKFDATHPGDHVSVTFIANTPFKQRLLVSMSAHKPPTLWYSWGGGVLEQYIKAGDAVPVASSSVSWAKKIIPAALGPVTFNNQIYGVPIQGTQPVFFYFNRTVFQKEHLTFPKTWTQLLSDVTTFNKAGVIPIEMGNESGWEGLMYLEYLTDRIGGPKVFDAIQAHTKGSWSNPAVTQALTDIQQLSKATAFQKGYDAVDYGTETDALLYTGKAAMTLMGEWEVPGLLGESASFVNTGQLGQAAFPTVPGGKGNPGDLAGNTSEYLALSAAATSAQQAVAKQFLQTEFTTTSFAKTEIASGQVPALKGSLAPLEKTALHKYLVPLYQDVYHAPSYQYSWDQALGTKLSEPLYLNLTKVFELTETPKQFESAMNAALTSPTAGL
jgi:raffinose/stachyose/melibiose transport system substrate-binding protein